MGAQLIISPHFHLPMRRWRPLQERARHSPPHSAAAEAYKRHAAAAAAAITLALRQSHLVYVADRDRRPQQSPSLLPSFRISIQWPTSSGRFTKSSPFFLLRSNCWFCFAALCMCTAGRPSEGSVPISLDGVLTLHSHIQHVACGSNAILRSV